MEEIGAFKILCPYCNSPYDARMIAEIEFSGYGCDTCGPSSPDGALEIYCTNCKKLVYKKEYTSYD